MGSWIRPYGKGSVFYCTLGHAKTAYTNPAVMKHYLAGIQLAIGDLPAIHVPSFWMLRRSHRKYNSCGPAETVDCPLFLRILAIILIILVRFRFV